MRLLGARQPPALARRQAALPLLQVPEQQPQEERQRLAVQHWPALARRQAARRQAALRQEALPPQEAHWRREGQLQGVRRPALEDLGWRVRRQAAATDSARCSRISSRRAEMASRVGLGGNCCRAG